MAGPAIEVMPMLRQVAAAAAAGSARAVVESGPDKGSMTLSYKDLLANVEKLYPTIVALLATRKADLPKHVALLAHPSFEYVVAELAIWAAGAACVPLSVHSPGPELEYFVKDAECALFITDRHCAPQLGSTAEKLGRGLAVIAVERSVAHLPATLSSSTIGEPLAGGGGAGGATHVTPDSSALIMYTSGTTGQPKGVVHTISSVTAQYESLTKAWKWTAADYTLHVLPLHHMHGVQNVLNTALFNGAGVELTPFNAEFCLERLASGDVTCFHAVPTMYVKFTQFLERTSETTRQKIRQGLRNPALRYMVSGSAALPVPTMKSWAEISGHVLLERYGMTETGMVLSNNVASTRYPGCVGWPLPKVEVKLDADGSILTRGPCLFKEYYKRPEATKKEFAEGGWFRTGDACQVGGSTEELQALNEAARELEECTQRPTAVANLPPTELKTIYRIMGRSSVDIIKSGGYKLSGLEIESALLQHPHVQECAVLGMPDETWGEKVTAVCVLTDTLTIQELREWCKERMSAYKVPQELVAVDALPRNQMGKVEKKKLIESLRSRSKL